MTPAQYCEEKTRGAGSSFFYAFLFLPPEQRRAMMALYAFCREVDDIADDVHEQSVALQKLHFWHEEIGRAFAGRPQHPVARELEWAGHRYNLPQELFAEILEGMRMDIEHRPILDPADLSQYCYRVAGTVGLLSIEVFGHRTPQARDFAITLGEALQLTNILRDLREDAGRGRIYIPERERIRFDVADQDLLIGRMTPAVSRLLGHYLDKTAACYARALSLLPREDRESLRPSLLMGAIYYAHFKRLQQKRDELWMHPPTMSPLRKMWIAWRMWRYEKKALEKNRPPSFEV